MSQQPTPPEPKPSALAKVQQFWQTLQPILVKVWQTALTVAKQTKAFWDTTFPKVQRWWAATLPSIRKLLPETWNAKIADWMITSGAIAIVILLFWITTSLVFPHRAVAQSPKAPATQPAPKIKAPDPSKLLAIQNQLAETATPYGELIDTVRVQPQRNRLIVQVSDSWYGLAAGQQDQWANELFKRSLKLKYAELELVDGADKLVARSPVVGDKVVVLWRQMGESLARTAP
jgi:hypothetical protein